MSVQYLCGKICFPAELEKWVHSFRFFQMPRWENSIETGLNKRKSLSPSLNCGVWDKVWNVARSKPSKGVKRWLHIGFRFLCGCSINQNHSVAFSIIRFTAYPVFNTSRLGITLLGNRLGIQFCCLWFRSQTTIMYDGIIKLPSWESQTQYQALLTISRIRIITKHMPNKDILPL